MKLKQAIFGTVVFIVNLFAVYSIHVVYFEVDVVLYSALFDVLIAVLLTSIFVGFGLILGLLSKFEKCLLLIIWIHVGYVYAITIPTIIDRSLSIYILEKLDQRGGGIKADAFSSVFVEEYLSEHQLVAVRLTEQLESGTIILDEGCVRLTSRGEFIVLFSQFFRDKLLPKHRLLMGSYSDELTNIFIENNKKFDYTC